LSSAGEEARYAALDRCTHRSHAEAGDRPAKKKTTRMSIIRRWIKAMDGSIELEDVRYSRSGLLGTKSKTKENRGFLISCEQQWLELGFIPDAATNAGWPVAV
jgi:hypothetical protein